MKVWWGNSLQLLGLVLGRQPVVSPICRIMGCSSSVLRRREFFKVGNRVAAVKQRHGSPTRTGEMKTPSGAAWSPGIVTAVNEVQVMAKRYDRGSARVARQAQAVKRRHSQVTGLDTGIARPTCPAYRPGRRLAGARTAARGPPRRRLPV